jgi:hypothetical protein
MPAKPAWLLHISEILEQLQSLNVPIIDRCMCERWFCVSRRRAITLMQQFGACLPLQFPAHMRTALQPSSRLVGMDF